MRIIDAKDAHVAIGPKKNNAYHLGPEFGPVWAPEVEWKNVFVFFRRILGVFDRAVRALVKPFGVLFDVRMVGRTVDREIERYFHSALSDFRLQPVEILQRAE